MARGRLWTPDELTLVLDLYLKAHGSKMDTDYASQIADATGRSLQAIKMRFENYKSVDPSYTSDGRVGLPGGRDKCQPIWIAFARRPHDLAREVQRILKSSAFAEEGPPDIDSSFAEGGRKQRKHLAIERSKTLVQQAKSARMAETGRLACDICGFDFEQAYGEFGKGFIEAHHVIPLSRLDGNLRSTVADLALVCSNCHRMLHRKGNPTIEELREHVSRNRTTT